MAQGYDDDKTEALGGHIGFADVVTVEQLAAAGVPNRTVFDIRRRLDPVAAAAQVLCLYMHCRVLPRVMADLRLAVVMGMQGVLSGMGQLL